MSSILRCVAPSKQQPYNFRRRSYLKISVRLRSNRARHPSRPCTCCLAHRLLTRTPGTFSTAGFYTTNLSHPPLAPQLAVSLPSGVVFDFRVIFTYLCLSTSPQAQAWCKCRVRARRIHRSALSAVKSYTHTQSLAR